VCGNYVVVGDAEGWLHVLNRTDGQFAVRVQAGSSSGIYAAPLVSGNTIYTYANDGELSAWSLN
jgi:outer membrane protein assembly factor BamB